LSGTVAIARRLCIFRCHGAIICMALMRPERPRLSLLVATTAALVASVGNSQPINRTDGCDATAVLRPGLSPIDIVEGRPPLKDLWRTLGIPAKLRVSTGREFTIGAETIDCARGCKATIVSGDHFLNDGNDSIVRVCTEFDTTCRFLLLHQSAGTWRLLDYIDSPFEKYEPPTVGVEAAQDRRWLVQRGFGGGGTGVYLAVAEWFEMHCGALQPVLSLPSHGHDVNAKPARYFSTRFKAFHEQQGRESLEFGYVVLFQDCEHERQLWQEERTVEFSRQNSNSKFVFDPAASSISARFADKVFAFDSLNENDFVEFAFDRLLHIASKSGDPRQNWLRDFLSALHETPHVKALKAALNSSTNIPPRH
jgi:hypothetical protein